MASSSRYSDADYAALRAAFDNVDPNSPLALDQVKINFSAALASLEVAKERLVAAETDEARLAQVETCVDRVVSSSWRSPCLPLTG